MADQDTAITLSEAEALAGEIERLHAEIAQLRERVSELDELAHQDSLVGLPNRRELRRPPRATDRARRALRRPGGDAVRRRRRAQADQRPSSATPPATKRLVAIARDPGRERPQVGLRRADRRRRIRHPAGAGRRAAARGTWRLRIVETRHQRRSAGRTAKAAAERRRRGRRDRARRRPASGDRARRQGDVPGESGLALAEIIAVGGAEVVVQFIDQRLAGRDFDPDDVVVGDVRQMLDQRADRIAVRRDQARAGPT